MKELIEACQKGYMTHPTRKTKIMFGKRYRNCVKKEGVNSKVTTEQERKRKVVDIHLAVLAERSVDMLNVYQLLKLLV